MTARRDRLRELERVQVAYWQEQRIFEEDAPSAAEIAAAAAAASSATTTAAASGDAASSQAVPVNDKYFANFPYPYMNGKLHLGHASSYAKADFQAYYQRLKGARSLLPFGFHATGMPIKASADKLAEELAKFGNPPAFPDEPHNGKPCTDVDELKKRQAEFARKQAEAAAEEAKAAAAAKAAAKANKKAGDAPAVVDGAAKPDEKSHHAKKTKTASKTGTSVRQWDIMLASGIDAKDIPAFADAQHWLAVFPPLAKTDLIDFGAPVDWRRSFVTTDVNPYYDAFVRWQFRTLAKVNKLKFGVRYSIYSPKDGQPCADHDRASGEGVMPQEYTIVKLRMLEPLPKALESLSSRRLYLAPATLRPETMYGQTNCFVLPTGEYGLFELDNGDVFVMTERAARNLRYQGHASEVRCLLRVKGSELIGAPLRAPLAAYDVVYTLPLTSISMKKGTGVVTSVPSDAPDDYAALVDLQRKPAWREKFGVRDEWVMPYEPVPIIRTSEFGDLSAKTACEKFNIKSQNDAAALAEAKAVVYKAGFYDGVFIVGEHSGSKVSDVKTVIRDALIKDNDAIVYWEPTAQVISRSGDECVVCPTEQWYIDYAQPEWKAEVEAHTRDSLRCFNEELRKTLTVQIGWLHEWGCSRSFGLGTRLPSDEKYLIESLSDSTIYMAYYTIAHLLQGGNLDPAKVVEGDAHIKPEALADDTFWDYVFLGKGEEAAVAKACNVDASVIERCRREFDYWYPFDVRTSGKDLAYNHLVFSLFNHAAIFPKEKWPRGIKCSGFLEINKEKMSKSKGNFFCISDAIEKFSQTGARFGLADCGDSLDTANFDPETVNKIILRLTTQLDWSAAVVKVTSEADAAALARPYSFFDTCFDHAIRACVHEADRCYDAMLYHEAIKYAFFELQNARDRYVLALAEAGDSDEATLARCHPALLRHFVDVQSRLIAPVAPAFAEHLHRVVLGEADSSVLARGGWPAVGPVDAVALERERYVHAVVKDARSHIDTTAAKKKATVAGVTISVCARYADWQSALLVALRDAAAASADGSLPEKAAAMELVKSLPTVAPVMKGKKSPVMPFLAKTLATCAAARAANDEAAFTAALATEPLFDELATLAEAREFVARALAPVTVDVVPSADANDQSQGQPLKPAFKVTLEGGK